MTCLDSILRPVSPPLLALVLALAGCSDDGFGPPLDSDQADTGGSGNPTTGNDSNSSNGGTSSADGSGGTGNGPGEGTGSESDGTTAADDTTGGSPPPSACEQPDECVLINDCCQCAAAHVDDEIPECPLDCEQGMCDALGIGDVGVVCENDQCELESYDCSGNVACDAPPPECPRGTLPEVGPAGGNVGGCWTGACIPVAACDQVPGCEYCEADEACVQTVTQIGASYSCRAVPEACNGAPTCACMPPDTCEAPFDTCFDGDGGIQCECPAC